MATLPTLTAYDPSLIPNKATMTDEEFADAIHPYLNFWNGTTIPEINNWRGTLEQIRQEINDKYIAVKNQAVDGGYSQAYLDTKYKPPMQRTYYVDQINGDDVNDGSSGSPFRTLQKAIDSVPDSGSAHIYLKNDYTLEYTERVFIGYNKEIHLVISPYILTTSYGTSPSNSNYSRKGYFTITNAFLEVHIGNGQIIVPENNTGKTIDPPSYGFFQVLYNTKGTIAIKITSTAGGNWCEIHEGALIGCDNWSAAKAVINVMVYPHYNRALALFGSNSFFIHGSGSLINLFADINNNDGTGYITRDGNNISVADSLAGIIRDTNGIPRNIKSNVIV